MEYFVNFKGINRRKVLELSGDAVLAWETNRYLKMMRTSLIICALLLYSSVFAQIQIVTVIIRENQKNIDVKIKME